MLWQQGEEETRWALLALTGALGEEAEEANAAERPEPFKPLLRHVEVVAAEAERAGMMDRAGRLWNSLGYHLHLAADHGGARECYERALRILEKHLPPDHPRIRTVKANLDAV